MNIGDTGPWAEVLNYTKKGKQAEASTCLSLLPDCQIQCNQPPPVPAAMPDMPLKVWAEINSFFLVFLFRVSYHRNRTVNEHGGRGERFLTCV